MAEEVIVSIKGLQMAGGESNESVELISSGTHRMEKECHVIEYDEVDEENQEITNVTILLSKGHVEILKAGQSNVQMIFEENQKTTSCYKTPYGDLMVGLDTSKIKMLEEDDAIGVMLEYGLDMNYNHIADCTITMKILFKDGAEE